MARNETYEEFVEKFKPKKTTDDCYTPPEIYDCIRDWACEEYGIDPNKIVRPFWPGGDYENYDYPEGCVVLDNPPFSILSKIINFYLQQGIHFFLFAPGLTVFSGLKNTMRCCHIISDTQIIYENGAIVRTAFITDFEEGVIARSAPELRKIVYDVQDKKEKKKRIPKYKYPRNILTAAMIQNFSKNGIEFSVRKNECVPIDKLDVQKKMGKSIFGKGLLLSDKKAREKEAAEKMMAEKMMVEKMMAEKQKAIIWELSEREKEIIANMEVERNERREKERIEGTSNYIPPVC